MERPAIINVRIFRDSGSTRPAECAIFVIRSEFQHAVNFNEFSAITKTNASLVILVTALSLQQFNSRFQIADLSFVIIQNPSHRADHDEGADGLCLRHDKFLIDYDFTTKRILHEIWPEEDGVPGMEQLYGNDETAAPMSILRRDSAC